LIRERRKEIEIESGIMVNNTKKSENTAKQSFVWDSEKKRPSKLTFLVLITLTVIILITGVLSVIALYHEIKVVIDCHGDYRGNIEYSDVHISFDRSSKPKEFSFRIREDITIHVSIDRYFSSALTIEIYDNGNIATERTYNDRQGPVLLEYTVGYI
jgi:hypothetical protein